MRPADIAGGAPAWVWFLLVVLLVLGIRRVRTRETPVAVALIAPAAFLGWSVIGALAFAAAASPAVALAGWVGGALAGAVSGLALPDPRGQRLPGRRVRQPGSVVPLILYLAVFVARFGCGAWAAIEPGRAVLATATGLAIGAAMTARLVVGVARWRPAPPA